MMFDWLAFWCGFGAFPALMVLAFFAITFLLLFILVFRGYFDNREEESEDDDVDPVPEASRSESPSQGADVHVFYNFELTDDEVENALGVFNSSIDGELTSFSESLVLNYKYLDKLKPGKHDKKIAKVEENIFYTRFAISLLSFVQTHGEEAFLKYLQSTGFFDEDKLRARSVCDPFAPMPEDYPPLEEDKP